MFKFDLHLHTTASDGGLSPREIVRLAKKKGFKIIALADHDSIAGVDQATEEGKKLGIEVIPGLELSTKLNQNFNFHVLAYQIDLQNSLLKKVLVSLRERRKKRARLMIKRLQKLGFRIRFSDLTQEIKNNIGKPHIAKIILSKKENREICQKHGIKGIDSFIDTYLAYGKPAYVKREKIDILKAIQMIHQFGGWAILAHPTIDLKNKREISGLIKFLKKNGLDGIETCHQSRSKEIVLFLHYLAQKEQLIETAGSDFHYPERDKLGGYKFYQPRILKKCQTDLNIILERHPKVNPTSAL